MTESQNDITFFEYQACQMMVDVCAEIERVEKRGASVFDAIRTIERIAGELEAHCRLNPDRATDRITFFLDGMGRKLEKLREHAERITGEQGWQPE